MNGFLSRSVAPRPTIVPPALFNPALHCTPLYCTPPHSTPLHPLINCALQAQLKLEATSHAIETLKQLQQQNDLAIEAQIKIASDQLQEARQAAASKPKATALQLSMAKMKWAKAKGAVLWLGDAPGYVKQKAGISQAVCTGCCRLESSQCMHTAGSPCSLQLYFLSRL